MEKQRKKGKEKEHGAEGFQVLSKNCNIPAGKTADVLLHHLLLRNEQELQNVNPEPGTKRKEKASAFAIILNIKQDDNQNPSVAISRKKLCSTVHLFQQIIDISIMSAN